MAAAHTPSDLRGTTAIVTGASRGLGRAVAEALWRSGASVLLTARSEAALAAIRAGFEREARPGQTARCVTADLAEEDAADRILSEARRAWPQLNVLVNNAALPGPIGKTWDNDWDAWERTIRVNLLAPVQLCRGAARWMLEQGRGRIINLSGGGATGPRPGFSAYATAKAALVRFSEVLAHELADTEITVNCVAPGMMNTAMIEAVRRAGAAQAGAREYDQAVKAEQSGPDGGTARPAELVLFLASARSAGITGRLLSAVWDPWETLGDRAVELAASDIYTLRRIVPGDRGKRW